MLDSIYDTHEVNSSLSCICSEGCGMPQFWNLSSSVFDTELSSSLGSAGNSSSPLPLNQSQPTATSTPINSY